MRPELKVPVLGFVLVGLLAGLPRAHAVTFSHDDWQEVLGRFVSPEGLVDYPGLAEDRAALDRYIGALAVFGPTTHPERFPARDDQLAYYLNAYNALVVSGVLDRGIDRGVWGATGTGFGFFVRTKFSIDGRTISLRELENKLIRDQFGEPLIHAALNCASLSCPRLRQDAYQGATLRAQLESGMVEFVAQERNCRIDPDRRSVTLSKIFDWFRADFVAGGSREGDAGLIDYVNRYRMTDDQIPSGFRVEFAKYDKGLNTQSRQN